MKCFITNRHCIFERPDTNEEKNDSVFIIAPFGFPYDDLYELGIKENFSSNKKVENTAKKTLTALTSELGVFQEDVIRADKSLQLGYVMCNRICRNIRKAKFIYADISEANGNVYYELGLAFGWGKKIGLIRKKNSNHWCPVISQINSTGYWDRYP